LVIFFAFKVLPTIIFFLHLFLFLYYFGIIQFIVELFARVMAKTIGTLCAEILCCSTNIFVGQTEAPLLVHPYYIVIKTRSELLAVMIVGMAAITGGVIAAYVSLLKNYIPDTAEHLMPVSVM
jgi:CNT family concentrative nucleoside transporter